MRIDLAVIDDEWLTEADMRMIRLALNLFTWGCPTADKLNGEEKEREVKQYLPFEILSGLDFRYTFVALEALRVFSYWNSKNIKF